MTPPMKGTPTQSGTSCRLVFTRRVVRYYGAMTEKIYHTDPLTRAFDAEVVSVSTEKNPCTLVLNRTAFYPEGGGQPADRGHIAGFPVRDVQKRDDTVVHLLEAGAEALPGVGDSVRGELDWEHRFDYMQQHTGQHIISASMIHVGGYNTVAVHQGERYTTVECDTADIPDRDLQGIEELANATVGRNLAVQAFSASDAEIPDLGLRRAPKVSGVIRIVEIDGFDRVACGGVHTPTTGAVGMIKLTGVERIRGNIRTIWKIGRRALDDFREKTDIVNALVDRFSAQPHEIVARAERLEQALKQAQYDYRAVVERLAGLRVEHLIASADPSQPVRVVSHRGHAESAELVRAMAEQITAQQRVCALILNATDERLQWLIACSPDVALDFELVRRELLPIIEGRGGGKPGIWQGVGSRVSAAEAMEQAFRALADRVASPSGSGAHP